MVQVVKDPQNRDLEGQIKVFKFGYKIKAKIDEELNPQFDEPTQVFDTFEGKNFELVISKKGGYPNYDSCKFQGSKSAITIGGSSISDTSEGRTQILNYLKGAPELGNFDYKPWNDEQRNKVLNIISQYSSPGTSIQNLSKSAQPPAKQAPAQPKAAPTNETFNESLDDTTEDTMVTEQGDDFDDFINGLDL